MERQTIDILWQNTGRSFNTTPPSTLTDERIDILEGCITIWDRFNNIMQNGTGPKGDSYLMQNIGLE